jgi:hypothetical protein
MLFRHRIGEAIAKIQLGWVTRAFSVAGEGVKCAPPSVLVDRCNTDPGLFDDLGGKRSRPRYTPAAVPEDRQHGFEDRAET